MSTTEERPDLTAQAAQALTDSQTIHHALVEFLQGGRSPDEQLERLVGALSSHFAPLNDQRKADILAWLRVEVVGALKKVLDQHVGQWASYMANQQALTDALADKAARAVERSTESVEHLRDEVQAHRLFAADRAQIAQNVLAENARLIAQARVLRAEVSPHRLAALEQRAAQIAQTVRADGESDSDSHDAQETRDADGTKGGADDTTTRPAQSVPSYRPRAQFARRTRS